jgi:DNA polymerase-3 subunit gamma/tau
MSSYVVTARKWRPQTFDDVVGQSHVTETLQNAIKNNRVGHAYLFSGPRGVGKTTIARIFAKALNCVEGPAPEPCNECENCVAIQSGTSMDIQEIDGASYNKVEDVRDIISNLGYHSTQCRYKMYIIDEVHMLSNSAFNALLKTIEEPPPGVIFVFATTDPQKIPATVLSRCQRYDFHRLSVKEITAKLRTIADADNVSIDNSSLMLIARRATGAMRDAESILEQISSSRGTTITAGDVSDVLGIADRQIFFDIVEQCHKGDTREALKLFNDYYDEGGDLKEFLEGLLRHLRDLLYAQFKDGLGQVILSEDMIEQLKVQSDWYGQPDIIRMIQIVTETESSIAYAVLPLLRIEIALARMAHLETTVQLKDLFDKLGGEEPRLGGQQNQGSTQSGAQPSATPVASEPVAEHREEQQPDSSEEECPSIEPSIESVQANWADIVERVGKVKPALAPSLLLSVPETFKNDTLTLSFKAEQNFHYGIVESSIPDIEEMVGALMGRKIHVKAYTHRPDAVKKKHLN